MLKEPFIQAKNIFDTFHQSGFECYFVGGSVRDYLSGRSIGDIDIATNAKPEDMQRIFPKTVPVGIEHGTVLILDQGHAFEVTTYRTESDYQDYRHPSHVSFVDDISIDLSRRDFTMNAIAMNFDEQLIDPFNGREDLKKGIIRTVRSPFDRFNEDPLRMLRGIRFVSQLNFNLDVDVKQAISKHRHLLKNISVERITDEMIKLLLNPFVNEALQLIQETEIHESLPIFEDKESLFQSLKQYRFTEQIDHPATAFSLLHLIEPTISIDKWAKQYKLSNDIKKNAKHLASCYNLFKDKGLTNYVLYQTKHDWLTSLLQLIRLKDSGEVNINDLKTQYDTLAIQSRKDLAISGGDLMKWFSHKKRGKWIGDLLEQIEYLVVENQLTNDEQAIEGWVREWEIREKD
ncbi:CCA tRNA nucleotidyltransferase [Tenuibacillus multivorans]|uniref:CCA-adding enzyme n=1 Tax=Tenuibacillus multivorans TaxID=237069 RepID=A0A1H0CTL3_9BACI|nr:CCA tRNA nucleotidyltransferase [Tenuibacillus multivorans]GEL76174.1 CCA-adding enzyme [Tenuibacillus multivorans]SDN61021.1 tRNA nucleotidyltransferase (CCA-adding enzyme) [Tenuibacillus multivorans]